MHYTSKLTDDQIEDIKLLYASGVSQIKLAEEYNVSRTTIQNSIRGYGLKVSKKDISDEDRAYWTQLSKESVSRIDKKYGVVLPRRLSP